MSLAETREIAPIGTSVLTSVYPRRSRPCPVPPDAGSVTSAIDPGSRSPSRWMNHLRATAFDLPQSLLLQGVARALGSGPSCSALTCTARVDRAYTALDLASSSTVVIGP